MCLSSCLILYLSEDFTTTSVKGWRVFAREQLYFHESNGNVVTCKKNCALFKDSLKKCLIGSSLWWIFSGTCSSQTSLSCSFCSARLTRAVPAGSIHYGCCWELDVCMCGWFMMSVFMMKENMAHGFHPSRLIITKSLNSSLHFSGSFPREDWFSP